MPDKDELDLLLDSALATYADPGPGEGLEQRVLAGLAAERNSGPGVAVITRVRRRGLVWAVPVAIAAAFLIALWMMTTRPDRVPKDEPPIASRVQPGGSTQSTSPAAPKAAVLGPHRRAIARAAITAQVARKPDDLTLPKRDVFPTPQPLTPEERALASVAIKAPISLRQALVAAQEEDGAPVRIAAIHVPPIEPLSGTQP